MSLYRVTFEHGRVGGDRGVGPFFIRAEDFDGLAHGVHRRVLPHLYSRFPEVLIEQGEDEESPTGIVFAGFHTVARFSVEEVADVAA